MANNAMVTPQNNLNRRFGSVFPLSENILNTNMAESMEVIRKVNTNIDATVLLKAEKGKASKKLNKLL